MEGDWYDYGQMPKEDEEPMSDKKHKHPPGPPRADEVQFANGMDWLCSACGRHNPYHVKVCPCMHEIYEECIRERSRDE